VVLDTTSALAFASSYSRRIEVVEVATGRLWSTSSGAELAELAVPSHPSSLGGVAFHPHRPILAVRDDAAHVIELWEYDADVLLGTAPVQAQARYVTARIALVGDSMVGKTHLGHRLATGAWKPYPSTHGQQFWLVPTLGGTRTDGATCEAVLWDFAGQADYRILHALFFDEIDVAILAFDASERVHPLKGVDFWQRQLACAGAKGSRRLLVGTKIDRGAPSLTDAELAAWCAENGVDGGYLGTSAERDLGVAELRDRLRALIDWDSRADTVSPITFKRVKDFVLGLREKAATGRMLVRPVELRALLEASDPAWRFTDEEMLTAVGHLARHGLVRELHTSLGEPVVLLAPDLLAGLAGSILLEARRNPHGLGAVDEARLLAGDHPLDEVGPLEADDRTLLLDAAVRLFLERNVCLREADDPGTFLIFPSLIHQKRLTLAEDAPMVEATAFRVRGAVEGVYPALVVLLGYTQQVRRRNQWQDEARYELSDGTVCGFRAVQEREGELELVLVYAPQAAEADRQFFEGLFRRLLAHRRGLEVERFPPVDCPACGHREDRTRVRNALDRGRADLRCDVCDARIPLTRPGKAPPETDAVRAAEASADVRTRYETVLVDVKRLVAEAGDARPSCFVSYAWGDARHGRWVEDLAENLRAAGIDVTFDRWHAPGGSLTEFVERVDRADACVVVGTPALRAKFEAREHPAVVAEELRLVGQRLRDRRPVLPVLRDGTRASAFPAFLQDPVAVDFTDDPAYFTGLLDLVLAVHRLACDAPGVQRIRRALRPPMGE
jgi:hypothetical protein